MAFCYKKLWHQLIDHDMSRTDLRDATAASAIIVFFIALPFPLFHGIAYFIKFHLPPQGGIFSATGRRDSL